MLELFPAFIVLASIGGRFRTLHLSYLMISGAILFFLLTQFLNRALGALEESVLG